MQCTHQRSIIVCSRLLSKQYTCFTACVRFNFYFRRVMNKIIRLAYSIIMADTFVAYYRLRSYIYRINGIESGRLEKQIQLLDRQKLHTVRLVNNDIRLTRITLDHIEASSGKSVNMQGEYLVGICLFINGTLHYGLLHTSAPSITINAEILKGCTTF